MEIINFPRKPNSPFRRDPALWPGLVSNSRRVRDLRPPRAAQPSSAFAKAQRRELSSSSATSFFELLDYVKIRHFRAPLCSGSFRPASSFAIASLLTSLRLWTSSAPSLRFASLGFAAFAHAHALDAQSAGRPLAVSGSSLRSLCLPAARLLCSSACALRLPLGRGLQAGLLPRKLVRAA